MRCQEAWANSGESWKQVCGEKDSLKLVFNSLIGPNADDFIHALNTRALNFYKKKKGRGLGKKSSGRLQKGVILYLCCADEDELKVSLLRGTIHLTCPQDLHYSLKLLYNHFAREFSYPVQLSLSPHGATLICFQVIILHDRLTQQNQTTLSAVFGFPLIFSLSVILFLTTATAMATCRFTALRYHLAFS